MAVKIVHGEDITLALRIKDSKGNPYDLTGVTEVTARFQKTDNTVLSKTLSSGSVVIESPTHGTLSVELLDADTSQLKKGDGQSLEVWIDVGQSRRIAQFVKSLNVASKLF